MANRRRRNRLPVVGRVRGQRGRVVVESSELHIDRQPDRIVVRNGPEAEHVSVGGREHHIYVHPEPREPRPGRERPFFEFEIMAEQLMEQVQKRVQDSGIKLGAREPKYASKFLPIAKNITHQPLKKLLANKWLPIHPFQLGNAILSSKKGGLRKLARDKSNYKKLQTLNAKYAPAMGEISRIYEAEAKRALLDLEEAVRAGEVHKGNRNHYFEKYKKAVHNAEIKFMKKSTELIANYGRELKGK